MNQLTDRTPQLIAAEINSIKEQTRKMLLFNSIEIGRRLVEAKAMISHGEWGEWLEKSVDYSQRTANNLMRIFEEYGSQQMGLFGNNLNSQALANLSYTQAVALLGVPQEEREQFVVENDIENMTTRELQQAIRERDEALKQLETAQQIAIEKTMEAKSLLDEKQIAEANAKFTDEALRTTQEEVEKLQAALQKEREESQDRVKDLQSAMVELESQLSEATASGDDELVTRLQETIEDNNAELASALNKIQDLERQLNEKPIEVDASTIIEKIPEEVERELNELREKAKELESKAEQGSPAILKYTVYFDSLVKGFKDLLGSLSDIKENNPEVHERYKNAVRGLLGKMSERL